jgi:two-component system response regulator HydG
VVDFPTDSAAPVGLVFLVEDEALVRRAVARSLSAAGFAVEAFDRVDSALEALEQKQPDLLLTDVMMPQKTGFDLLKEAQSRWPEVPVVLMTGQATIAAAVEAMQIGAYDYLVKPVDPQNTLIPAVRRAIERKKLVERNRFLESQLSATNRVRGLVGDSAAIRQVASLASAVASADVTTLVLGESGTGKELVARAVHEQSPRAGRAFVDINCASITDSLLESELFGHVKGAFTGALTGRRGLFETASGGTLFLDEVGELAQATQARLLRVLQEGEVRPVGSSESRRVDVRVIAATNRNLAKEVEAGTFRQDLFYRLNVFTIEIPPLRQRKEDIVTLVEHFLDKHATRFKRPKPRASARFLDALMAHEWPGNVRELENVVERALVLCRGDTVGEEGLPPALSSTAPASMQPPVSSETGALQPLAQSRDEFVRRYIQRVVAAANGNVAEAARIAGVDPSNFRRLLRRLEDGTLGDGD